MTMNKVWLWLLVFVVSFPIVFSVKVSLEYSSPNCINCESIYKITPDTQALSISENTMWFEFRKPATELMHGKDISTLRDWKVEMQDERLKEWAEQVLKDEGCKEIINEKNGSKEQSCNPVYETITKSVTEKYWKPIEDKTLSIGKEMIIKVSGNIKINSAVDNVLVLKEGSSFTKYTNWVWWNNSYAFRRDVLNETTSNIPVSINGTNKFLGHTCYINPYQCSGNISMYYNNATSFVSVCNDTTQMYMDCEDNSTYSYTASSVYPTNTISAWNFGISGSAPDSKNTNNGTISGTTFTTGQLGNAYSYDGLNDKIVVADSASLDLTTLDSHVFIFKRAITTATTQFVAAKATASAYGINGFNTLSLGKNAVGNVAACNVTFNTTNWYHVVFYHNSSNYLSKCYVNGIDVTTTYTGVTYTASIDAFNFGVYGASYWFNGTIDNYWMFNKEITLIEASILYNNTQNLNMLLGAEENSTIPDIIVYTINYTEPVTELSNKSFWINLSWTGNISSVVATNLEYNGTNYSLALLDNGSDWKRYNTSIIIPLTEGTGLADINNTFKWHYNYTNTTGTYSTNTTTTNQRTMEVYFFNSLSRNSEYIPELSNASLIANISSTYGDFSKLTAWNVILEFNGTNNTATSNTSQLFTYTEFIGIVTTNNTQINHTAYLNLSYGIHSAMRSGFTTNHKLITNYYPVATNNGNVTEGSSSIVTVTITNVSGAFTTGSYFTVWALWNGTVYTATQVNSTTWTYTTTAPTVSSDIVIAQAGRLQLSYAGVNLNRTSATINQTIQNIEITDGTCTPASLYIVYRDELNLNLSQYLSVNVETIVINDGTGENYTFNNTGIWNQSFCVVPAYSNFTATFWHVIKNEPGYYQREFRDKLVLSNVSQNKTMYLLNKSGQDATTTNIFITDASGKAIPNYFVQMYKFNVANNSYSFIESFKSSSEGKGVISNIDTSYYRFLVQDSSYTQVYESSTFKLTSADIYLRISEAMELLKDLINLRSITQSLSYTNSTGIVSFYWDDSADDYANQMCLRISNMTSMNVLSDVCSSSITGNLTYNLSAYSSGTYIATAWENGSNYLLDQLNINRLISTLDWGKDGLILAFIFFVAIALLGVGVSPITAIIMADLGLAAVILFGFLQLDILTFTTLIIGTGALIFLRFKN